MSNNNTDVLFEQINDDDDDDDDDDNDDNVRIRGQLPPPIVNGRGDSFWKWQDFQLWKTRDLDLDLGSGHTAYRRASLINLYLHAKFHLNQINFLWTDVHMDGRDPLY